MAEAVQDERQGRGRLLAASAELFRMRTVAGTSMRMIANQAGMTPAAIYHHFSSRDDIIQAVHRPLCDDIEDAIDRLSALPASQQGAETRKYAADLIVRHRGLMRMLFDKGAMTEQSAAQIEYQTESFIRLISGGKDDAATLAEAEAILFGAAAVALRRHDLTDQALRPLIERILHLTSASN